jgi:alkylation response protein AidB-like acyl-CoA dehydrogenase
MDLSWKPEDEAFRKEVRSYLESNLPKDLPEDGDESFEARREWQAKMAEDSWVAIHWPKEFGGRGASVLQTIIYNEEYTRLRGPRLPNELGLALLGPTLMEFGTDEQKQKFLKRVLTAEDIWCQGFSEPNSGSDLASLQCKAEIDGDDFVVNGQKIWTSYGKYADWIFNLVRTDREAEPHKGISFLLADMKSPGIEVRPLKEISGDSLFSEVFFTDVRTPKENLVGELGQGWSIAMRTLTFERGAGSLATSVRLRNSMFDLIADAQKVRRNGWSAFEDPVSRDRIAKWLVDLEVYRYTTLRAISSVANGRPAGSEASINKVYWSEWHREFMADAVNVLGPLARVLDGAEAEINTARWAKEYLLSLAGTIYAGTSEVQRNIIAERVLGLPKEARA